MFQWVKDLFSPKEQKAFEGDLFHPSEYVLPKKRVVEYVRRAPPPEKRSEPQRTLNSDRSYDPLTDPLNPLNPLSPLSPFGVFADPTPASVAQECSPAPDYSSSYDYSSSSSSYDSGSSSCDSGSSSGGGD